MRYINKSLRLASLLLVLTAVYAYHLPLLSQSEGQAEPKMDYLPYLQEIFSEAHNFEYAPSDDEWSPVFDREENILGWFVSTTPYLDHIQGYAGPVPLLITAGAEKEIAGTVLLPHDETPGFMQSVRDRNLFRSWDGKPLEEAARLEIDTISGATMTSQAIIEGVQRRLEMVGYEPFSPARLARINFTALVISLLVYLGALAGFFRRFGIHHRRPFFLLLNVFVLGIWTTQMLSLFFFRSFIVRGIPWLTQPFMVLLLISAVLFPLISGKNFYCSHLCPFGSLQEIAGKVLPKTRIKIPSKLHSRLSWFRVTYLAVILVLVFTPFTMTLESWEPFAAFRLRSAAVSTLVIAVTAVFFSLFIPRIWCRFACPTGQVLDFLKRKPHLKRKDNHEH